MVGSALSHRCLTFFLLPSSSRMLMFGRPELFFACNQISLVDLIACLALPSRLPSHPLHPPSYIRWNPLCCLYLSPSFEVHFFFLFLFYIMLPVDIVWFLNTKGHSTIFFLIFSIHLFPEIFSASILKATYKWFF